VKISKRQLRRLIREYEFPGSIPAEPWDPVKGYPEPPEGMEGYFDNTVSKSVYRPIQDPDAGQLAQPQSSGPKVEVEWDLGDTEFEDMPYEQAIKAAGLPSVVELPGDLSEYELNDWLSDEYGFTHHGWEPINESKMKITKRQLKRIIKEEKTKLLREATRSKPWAWEEDLESLHQNPEVLRDKEQQLIELMEGAIVLLDSMKDFHHMPQVEKVLESMRKVYQV